MKNWLKALISKPNYRNLGDAARNDRDWPAAQHAYEAHLQSHGDDFAIWVQLGHSRKEQGNLQGAEDAYRHALTLQPSDADALMQLGHVLKLTGRLAEAKLSYAASFRKTGSHAAYTELLAVQGGSLLDGWHLAKTPTSTIYIEINDLFGYLEAHRTLSGIQRVQVSIIEYVLYRKSSLVEKNCHFILNIDGRALWVLRNSDLDALVSYVLGASVDHGWLRQLISRSRENATAVSPVSGQCYFVLGAFWQDDAVGARYLSLKKEGVIVGACIYDLIPIYNPEYFDTKLAHEFALSLGDGLALFDFTLAISEYTAQEIRQFQSQHQLPSKPVAAIPLAHAQSIGMSQISGKAQWIRQIARFRERSFALMVSTIEARKNHIYLVLAWKQMIEEGLDPPDLVFVGRFGWRVSQLTELLDATNYLEERVHVLHDLSDVEVAALYDACLFTCFPSFLEGWGLPIGESLARGKPCVASRTSSIPEVGGDLVDYIDPYNLCDGIQVLRRMCFDSDYRTRRANQIRKELRLRTWKDVGDSLFQKIEEMHQTLHSTDFSGVEWPAGVFFRPQSLAYGQPIPKNYPTRPVRLILGNNWYRIDSRGCWIRGSNATLSLKSEFAPDTPVVVYVEVCCAPWATSENLVTIRVGRPLRTSTDDKQSVTVPMSPDSQLFMTAHGVIGDQGNLSVRLEIAGDFPLEWHCPETGLFLGAVSVSGLAYAAISDTASQTEIADKHYG